MFTSQNHNSTMQADEHNKAKICRFLAVAVLDSHVQTIPHCFYSAQLRGWKINFLFIYAGLNFQ